MARIPFLIVGDHPTQATGLARILGDIARRMHADYADLLDVRTCGWAPWMDLPHQGVEQDADLSAGSLTPFPHWVFSSTRSDWGSHAAVSAYRRWWGDQDGFLLTVWDPGRCLEYSRIPLPVTKWGYFAIDAANVNGGMSGPAADAVKRYDRVLAYTKFGARVLAKVGNDLTIPHLPHGLDLGTFQPINSAERSARAKQILRVPDGRQVIGCVATNQPRKDWGLVAQVIKCLVSHNFGYPLHLWAHTDRAIGEAWSLPQLFADCGIADRVTLTPPMGDRDLAACYAACIATIAPGRGEGFCYPAAESLASGTPCFGAKHSGLAELLPAEWQLSAELEHLVGPYALSRPILDPDELALQMERCVLGDDSVTGWATRRDQSLAAVRHLDWTVLWPQWTAWIDRGLGRG